MHIISFIDRPEVIKKILQHLSLGQGEQPDARAVEAARKKRSLLTFLIAS